MSLNVLIAGGGISGLVTAYRLLEREPTLEVQVLEAAGRLGGTMGTEVVQGLVFERGPNGFLDNVSSTLDLARELGLQDRLRAASSAAKKRYLLKKGRLHALPQGPGEFLRSPLLSFGGKLRLLAEPFQARGEPGEDESVAAFGRRRLGAEAAATFFDPLVTGIYAGDVERVSLESAFPRLAAMERGHGSLFRALLALRREKRRAPAAEAGTPPDASAPASAAAPAGAQRPPSRGTGQLHSFEHGLEDLVEALATRLAGRIRLNAPVEEVRRGRDGYDVVLRDRSVVRSRCVVAALPSPRTATLVSSWNPDLAMALEEIPYAPVAVVCLGYERAQVEHPLDGFGFLIPRDQGVRILGVIFVSSIFPAHAPEGTASLRVLVGGARDPEVVGLTAEDLEALVLREAGPILGLRGEPIARRIYRYAQGIPQYNVGHAKRLRRIDGWLKEIPGFFVTGNAYRGVGINDCVAEGGRVARDVLQFISKIGLK